MLKRYLKNAIIKNAGWLIFGKVIQMLLSLVVGMLTARYLGPSNYGLINYASAYTAFFTAFCTLGINSVLVKEFVDNPVSEGEIIGSTLVLRAISSFLSAVMIICIVGIADRDEPTTIAVTVLCSIGLVFNIFETYNYWFQSKLMSKVTAIASLAAYAITSGYKVVLLLSGKSVEWFAFANALDYICVGVFLSVCYKKAGGQRLSFSRSTCKRLLSSSVHFILPSLMVATYGYSDRFMLKQMQDETMVGYYSTATAVCGMWCFVLSAIIDSMFPSIMEEYKCGNKEAFEMKNRQIYAIVFYLSVSISLLLCLLGKPVIRILYGEAYLPAVVPLRVVTWYTAFSYLGVARNAWIVCESKQKYLKGIYVTAAVGNIFLNLLLIPVWAATGAAVASLITQILTTMVVPFFIKDVRPNAVLMLESICRRKIR